MSGILRKRNGTIIKSAVFQQSLIILLLLPLLVINTRSSHDWGGDFAQYINQARCIIEGVPQSQTGYIFNNQNSLLGPPTYPPGFPLLLSPLYLVFGNSILAFSIYISCFLIGAGFVIFRIFRLRSGYILSLLLTLLFMYNPWVLNFKSSILSDIPFTFFFILAVYIYSSHSFKEQKLAGRSLLLGGIIGFSMVVKSQGIILMLAFLLDGFIHMVIGKKMGRNHALNHMINLLLIIASTLTLYLVLAKGIFPGTSNQFSFFHNLNNLSQALDPETSLWNYYIWKLMEFFSINIILASLTIALFLIGILRHLIKEPGHILYTVILFLVMLILFPAVQGFRYLLPIYPLIMLIMVDGIRAIHLSLGRLRYGLIAVAFIIIASGYIPGYKSNLESRGEIIFGPQSGFSEEAFDYIKGNTEDDAVIAFAKPRVLALYAERRSIGPSRERFNTEINEKYKETGVNYILTLRGLRYPGFDEYLEYLGSRAIYVWSNGYFTLYSVDYNESFE